MLNLTDPFSDSYLPKEFPITLWRNAAFSLHYKQGGMERLETDAEAKEKRLNRDEAKEAKGQNL